MSVGQPNPPDYDNIRLSGPDGLRYPLEVGKATFVVKKSITLSAVAGSQTLNPAQSSGSYFRVTNTGATTLIFPLLPGHEFVVNNLAASTGSVTVEVAGQSATPIAVAAGFLQSFVIDDTEGVVPTSAAVAV